ncbi:hypothetical protein CH253_16810 [Rhodococcus sp. 06-156-3C]|nr:hypothetical protein CH253_16810 [Rhodococcus sp. 06-156-3C]OZD22254.1 hypothetical protein CH248_08395 [Rhodococcus sp. 06-156-4a]OZD34060.1 hypothetical protein CH247_08220 [Rhodococcus sp. 06-156-3b]OZD38797.1 hypothetical protein CH284_06640 [Rhodococcus sp. 06-156-3]OZF57257.1 hypothetical protein CH290_27425 [Rhodococcus sp. 06-156-4]
MIVTFIIAQITDEDGELSLIADTKLTVEHDDRATRQIYTRPCQKVVILDDDVVAGFAGDTPETSLRHLAGLRGMPIDKIVENLVEYTARLSEIRGVSKSFVIANRAPDPQLWTVSNGAAENRTGVGTAWVGDRDAHRAYTKNSMEWPSNMGKKDRFVSSVMSVIALDDIPSVGGYMVRVTGSSSHPFRFVGDVGSTGPWFTEALVARHDGTTSVQFVVPQEGDATEHTRIVIPGQGPTFSALAHYIPECDTALLNLHDHPDYDPITLRVGSVHELFAVAKAEHGQHLQMPSSNFTRRLLGLQPLQ